MQSESLNTLHLRQSMVGEEDPGAALDVVTSMLRRTARNGPESTADAVPGGPVDTAACPARIQLSCSDDGRNIDIGVT